MSTVGGLEMKRFMGLSATLALMAALAGTSAFAKGASEATITGPGLGDGITLAGEGQVGGERLMQLAETTGFFPAVFLRAPNPMLAARPKGRLGPRYTITYTMPGPGGGVDQLRQDLYPYATPTPVTYVKPGQPFFGTDKTVGGWFVASTTLKDDLVAVGLPETPPVDTGGSSFTWTGLGVFVAAVVAVVAAGVAVLVRRRRPDPVTA
jgi:hypothetical protein